MIRFKIIGLGIKGDYEMFAYKEGGTSKVRVFDFVDRIIYDSEEINLTKILEEIKKYETEPEFQYYLPD